MKRIWKKLAAAGMALLMTGCGKTAGQEIVSGGVTDKSDPNAPKVIESTEITEFSVSVFLAERWTDEERHPFDFAVKPDENGVLTAYEMHSGIRYPADDTLLCALQEVISQNDLAAMNGVYRVVAGLAPTDWPRELKVQYASGETLQYTVNNNPYEAWALQICDVFSDWFQANGIEWHVEGRET